MVVFGESSDAKFGLQGLFVLPCLAVLVPGSAFDTLLFTRIQKGRQASGQHVFGGRSVLLLFYGFQKLRSAYGGRVAATGAAGGFYGFEPPEEEQQLWMLPGSILATSLAGLTL